MNEARTYASVPLSLRFARATIYLIPELVSWAIFTGVRPKSLFRILPVLLRRGKRTRQLSQRGQDTARGPHASGLRAEPANGGRATAIRQAYLPDDNRISVSVLTMLLPSAPSPSHICCRYPRQGRAGPKGRADREDGARLHRHGKC